MRWNHFKSKLLFKYILSYLSIFLVPLIVMTFIIYQNAVNNLRSEIEQSSISQLEQAKRNIDGRMKEPGGDRGPDQLRQQADSLYGAPRLLWRGSD